MPRSNVRLLTLWDVSAMSPNVRTSVVVGHASLALVVATTFDEAFVVTVEGIVGWCCSLAPVSLSQVGSVR